MPQNGATTGGKFHSKMDRFRAWAGLRYTVLCPNVTVRTKELFNDWEGRGCDNSVPEEVTKTTSSGDRTA